MSSKQLPSLKNNAYHKITRITSNDEWLFQVFVAAKKLPTVKKSSDSWKMSVLQV